MILVQKSQKLQNDPPPPPPPPPPHPHHIIKRGRVVLRSMDTVTQIIRTLLRGLNVSQPPSSKKVE